VQLQVRRIREQQKQAALMADHIVCVSDALAEYLQQMVDIKGKPISTIPCAADRSKFFFDESIRKRVRKQLDIVDKIVVTYCGSFSHGWQVPDKILELVGAISETLPGEVFFLVLTPDREIAHQLVEGSMNSSNYRILTVNHSDVPKYLMASDLGLLLREEHILNAVASPTKFAEYLLCGVPVVVSKGIGDTSEIVQDLKGGVVLNGLTAEQDDLEKIADILCVSQGQAFRVKLSQAAAEILSKEIQLEQLLVVYTGTGE